MRKKVKIMRMRTMENDWNLSRRCYKFNVQRSTGRQEYILKISVLGGGPNWNFFMITSIWGGNNAVSMFTYCATSYNQFIEHLSSAWYDITSHRKFWCRQIHIGKVKKKIPLHTTLVAPLSCTNSKMICVVYWACFAAETKVIKWLSWFGIENYNLEVEKCFGRTAVVEHDTN